MPDALPLYRAETVRALERAAATRGIDSTALMARAGAAVASAAMARWPEARRIGVLCGRGNNGGDGYVAALALHRVGLAVTVLACGEPATPEAREAARAWREAGQGVVAGEATSSPRLPDVELWIDALFGVGLSRDVDGVLADLLRAVGEQAAPVLAVDVPSGLDADTGTARGTCLRADLTFCLVGAKRGLFTGVGRDVAGEVRVDALGLASDAFEGLPPDALAVAAPSLQAALPVRHDDSHKGSHGRVLCIGGDVGTEGALVLCAEAAARAGAGSVVAWTRPGAAAALQTRRPEVMAMAVDPEARSAAGEKASVIALGPGLGREAWGRCWFAGLVGSGNAATSPPATNATSAHSPPPMVLDADALTLLADRPCPLPGAVLTPHPGEAARLLGISAAAVQADRFAALDALVERFRCVVVLKGAGTLVGGPGECTRVLRAGNPGMATAGMGDALCGIIAALRAQGLEAFRAAWVGALAHAAAGDVAAGRRPRGLLAGDLIDALREVLNP